VIIAVYVDDQNIIGTPKEIDDARTHMKEEFEIKDLGKTKFCLGLQIEHFQDGIFVHQSNYTKRTLKRFNMDKANSLSTSMVNRSLNVENDPFRPCEDNEDFLGPKVPYMSAIVTPVSLNIETACFHLTYIFSLFHFLNSNTKLS